MKQSVFIGGEGPCFWKFLLSESQGPLQQNCEQNPTPLQNPPLYLLRSFLYHEGSHLYSFSFLLILLLSSFSPGDRKGQRHVKQVISRIPLKYSGKWTVLNNIRWLLLTAYKCNFQDSAYLATPAPPCQCCLPSTPPNHMLVSTSQKNVQVYK